MPRIVKSGALLQRVGGFIEDNYNALSTDSYLASDTLEIKKGWRPEGRGGYLQAKLDVCDKWISTCSNRAYDGSRCKNPELCLNCKDGVLDHFEAGFDACIEEMDKIKSST